MAGRPLDPSAVETEIAHLRSLGVEGLRARWHTMMGRRSPPHLPRHLLFRMLAYRLQADAFGDLERVIQLREGDKILQMTVANAVRRAETVAALKGNTHAQRNFLEREERYKKELAEEIESQQALWRR